MEDLIELVRLLKKSKFRLATLSALLMEPGSQMERLFEGISNGKIQSECDLFNSFPEINQSATRAAALKYKLKERLLSGVLILDFEEPAYGDRQDAYLECQRKYAAAMVLLSKGARLIGGETLETLLRQTLRFEFTELNISVLRALSRHYAFVEAEKKRYGQYETLLTQQETLLDFERQTEHFYKDLIENFVRRKDGKVQLQEKAAYYWKHIQPWMAQYDSYWLQFMGRLIEIIYYDSKGDYTAVAVAAESGIHFFEQKSYKSSSAFQAMHNYLLAALFSLHQFDRCKFFAEQYESRYESGSFNWFKMQELRFLIFMHMADYEQARQCCAYVTAHVAFKQESAPVQEMWKIFEAFLAYLQAIGVLMPGEYPTRFRMARFVNEIQVFSQDKSGMNIPVLLIQYLFALQEESHEHCFARMENMAKYRLRHLADPRNQRSYCFFRMLEQIPQSGFQPELVKRRTDKLLATLSEESGTPGLQNYEMEIIPYETLWDLVCSALFSNKRISNIIK